MNTTGDIDTVTVRAALVAIRVMDEAHPWTPTTQEVALRLCNRA